MAIVNVLIDYRPYLYTDLFDRLFQRYGEVHVSQNHKSEMAHDLEAVDVVVLSVNKEGKPDFEILPHTPPEAMLVAFSPCGNFGLVRQPGEESWSVVSPFGLDELVKTVLAARYNGNGSSSRD